MTIDMLANYGYSYEDKERRSLNMWAKLFNTLLNMEQKL